MSVSIVYCSCYMYRSLWTPFIELKRKYFNNNSIQMYLCTDGPLEEIRAKMGDIPILHYGERANNNTNYMTRVVSYLKRIDTKYVIFWYDDMFLTGMVDWESFNDAHTLMEANPEVKLIKLSECSFPFSGKTIQAGSTTFQLATPQDGYIMNVQPTLFDRAFLLDVMEEVDTNPTTNGPSEFETMGTRIAAQKPFIYLRSLKNTIPIFGEGGVVRAGILFPAAQAFLQKEGIDIDLCDKNCIYDTTEKSNTDTLNHQLKLELRELFNISL
jgi:hypothetical protein